MVCWSIDDVLQPMTGDHIRIMNEDRPDVYTNEEGEMEMFLNGEEVGKNVIGEGLEVTVDWMESVCGEGSGDNPLMVWLVNILVDAWVVFQSVNPVNAVIGKDEEPKSIIRVQKRSEQFEKHVRWD